MPESSIRTQPAPAYLLENWYGRVLSFLVIFLLFMFSLELMSMAFRSLEKDIVEPLVLATSNPFVGLFIGLLATAIAQSSSSITSVTVAIVAAGTLTLEQAVPIVMGANVGTTVTATLVAMGYLHKRKAFGRAMTAATSHAFFNIVVLMVLFPLEYAFGFLSNLALSVTRVLTYSFQASVTPTFKPWDLTIRPVAEWLLDYVLFDSPWLAFPLAMVLLFVSLRGFQWLFKRQWHQQEGSGFEQYVFGGDWRSLFWGIGATAAVRSSSVTTSLVVPLVSTNRIHIEKAFPFVIGANIGTTVTALTAALFKSEAAVSLALVHLLFNVLGAMLLYPLPVVRRIPLYCAHFVGYLCMRSRLVSFVYLIVTFFLIPFILISTSAPRHPQTKQEKPVTLPAKPERL